MVLTGSPLVAAGLLAAQFPARNVTVGGRWNEEMTRILREAAQVREQLAQVRSAEDSLLANRQAGAILALIRAHAAPADVDAEPRHEGDVSGWENEGGSAS